MEEKPKVAMIGGGSWATALVKILTENNERVGWWMRNEEAIEHVHLHGHNPNYLSSVFFDPLRLDLSTDLNQIVRNHDILVFAVPSAFLKKGLEPLTEPLSDKMVVSAIKGIVPDENQIVGEYLHNRYDISYNIIAVVTGPCHAEEVALERLSYLTAASENKDLAKLIKKNLQCDYIKVTTSDDIIGSEYAAVMKNIIAIAAGICHALGYGDNFQAVLVVNAIKEMKHFIKNVYPNKRDITDSAYLGDLLVTAYSQFSRNRTFGNMIGKGYSVRSAMLEMNMVAEGYYAVDCIKKMGKLHDVSMPICNMVYKVVYEGKSPRKQVAKLADKMK
ncbi:MAG: NAD(P)H-dependent glycerol-3-phosphate dehydrogenase [Flavobacteriales bacterium]|nr:NAD(P)H-dependent glycerol-3-phosphate dehydrogenase [Flavobacteriales bacterium]